MDAALIDDLLGRYGVLGALVWAIVWAIRNGGPYIRLYLDSQKGLQERMVEAIERIEEHIKKVESRLESVEDRLDKMSGCRGCGNGGAA